MIIYMWFWIVIFICDLLIPLLMIIGGLCMNKKTPKKINNNVGYRTKRSMKNIETWNFANKLCGKLWWIIGAIIILPAVLVHIPFRYSKDEIISILSLVVVVVEMIALIAPIFYVESQLKKNFYNNCENK